MATVEIPRSTRTCDPPLVVDRYEERLAPRVTTAFDILLDALEYARDMQQSEWHFAVEISDFHRLRLSNSDLRWLVGRGFVNHGIEVTLGADSERIFRHTERLMFCRKSCFVLTPAGASLARQLSGRTDSAEARGMREPPLLNFIESPSSVSSSAPPKWDRDRQELWLGKVLIKRFRVPAVSQEAVLAAFEEEHWPPRIDDPLPPRADQVPKRRLQETIKSLNKNQKRPLIRFLGDGSGQGVLWEFNPVSPDL